MLRRLCSDRIIPLTDHFMTDNVNDLFVHKSVIEAAAIAPRWIAAKLLETIMNVIEAGDVKAG